MQAKKHLTPKLIDSALQQGIRLIPADPSKPLEELGHIDALLHKIRDEGGISPMHNTGQSVQHHADSLATTGWVQQLQQYSIKHPDVKIVDPPSLVKNVRSRASMLSSIDAQGLILEVCT